MFKKLHPPLLNYQVNHFQLFVNWIHAELQPYLENDAELQPLSWEWWKCNYNLCCLV